MALSYPLGVRASGVGILIRKKTGHIGNEPSIDLQHE